VLPAYRRAGHRVRAVLTGNDSEWSTRFRVACQA
jgi:hypothetical protein